MLECWGCSSSPLFTPHQKKAWRHTSQPSVSSQPFESRNSNCPPPQKLVAKLLNHLWLTFYQFPCAASASAAWYQARDCKDCSVLSPWEMLHVCPQQQYLPNQPTGSILPSVTQRSWTHLVIAFSASSSEVGVSIERGFFCRTQISMCECSSQCSLYLLLRGPKLSGPHAYPRGCWIFCGLIPSLVFSTTLCLVFIIAHRWLLSCGELSRQRC